MYLGPMSRSTQLSSTMSPQVSLKRLAAGTASQDIMIKTDDVKALTENARYSFVIDGARK